MQKIRACDSPEEDLLGSDPCAWGPHYWCKNMATAVECHVSVGRVPSPGSAGCWGSLSPPPPSLPISPAGCRALPASPMELGATSPAGRACSAVLVQDPRLPPLGCACARGWRWQEPTGLTTPAGAVGCPSHLCHSLFHPWGLDFQIRLRDSLVFSGLRIQPHCL